MYLYNIPFFPIVQDDKVYKFTFYFLCIITIYKRLSFFYYKLYNYFIK